MSAARYRLTRLIAMTPGDSGRRLIGSYATVPECDAAARALHPESSGWRCCYEQDDTEDGADWFFYRGAETALYAADPEKSKEGEKA